MGDAKIRVMLADDQEIILQGLKYIINAEEDMEVIAAAEDGEQAVRLAEEKLPDIILMDIQMPGMNGIESAKKILAVCPEIKIVLLTTFDVEDYVFQGIRAGAVGYLLKDSDAEQLIQGIRWALAGQAVFRSSVAGKVIARMFDTDRTEYRADGEDTHTILPEPLTERELEVLQLMAYGRKNSEISEILFISQGTVKTHVHRIIQKLGVEERTQAVVLAIRSGLVD